VFIHHLGMHCFWPHKSGFSRCGLPPPQLYAIQDLPPTSSMMAPQNLLKRVTQLQWPSLPCSFVLHVRMCAHTCAHARTHSARQWDPRSALLSCAGSHTAARACWRLVVPGLLAGPLLVGAPGRLRGRGAVDLLSARSPAFPLLLSGPEVQVRRGSHLRAG